MLKLKSSKVSLIFAVATCLTVYSGIAQSDFYKGKTITVVAGTGAGILKLNDDGGTVTTGGSLQPSGGIIDKDGQLGNAGQVLSSTGAISSLKIKSN